MKSAKKIMGVLLVLSLVFGCFAALGVSAYAIEDETVIEEKLENEVVGEKDEPKDEVVEEKDEPGDEAVGEKDEPKDEAVEEKDDPKDEAVEEKDGPKDEAVEEKDEPKDEAEKKAPVRTLVKLEGTHEHSLKKIDGKPAVCQDGWADYFHCETCNKYFSDAAGEKLIGKDGNEADLEAWKLGEGRLPAQHNFKDVEGVEPNCVEEGYFPSVYCEDCKRFYTNRYSPRLIGSSYEDWLTWACTSAELGGGKLGPLGHVWSCWHVCEYPTKNYDGLMVRCCTREGCSARQFHSVRYDCCPKTGDESHIALWATMCALSVIMLGSAGGILLRRRKNGTF